MTKRRKLLIILLLAFTLAGLLAGTCGVFLYRFEHAGEGPQYRFPLPGSAALTDDQALDYSRKVMELDGRYKPSLQQMEFGSVASGTNTFVGRGSDPQYTTVYWYDGQSNRQWFVQLRRKKGEVVGVSSPGH